MNVRIEGENAVRHLDIMTHNRVHAPWRQERLRGGLTPYTSRDTELQCIFRADFSLSTARHYVFHLRLAATMMVVAADPMKTADCPAGDVAWYCGVISPSVDSTDGCADDVAAAKSACTAWLSANSYTGEFMFGSQVCDELVPAETGSACTGWSPSSNVTYNSTSGVYEVDQDFADDVINDPSHLVHCDDAYITVHSSAPVYGITNISTGDLADLLGLSNGDRFDTINDIDLDSKGDLVAAVVELYLDGETDFELVVDRAGVGSVTLTYELVP